MSTPELDIAYGFAYYDFLYVSLLYAMDYRISPPKLKLTLPEAVADLERVYYTIFTPKVLDVYALGSIDLWHYYERSGIVGTREQSMVLAGMVLTREEIKNVLRNHKADEKRRSVTVGTRGRPRESLQHPGLDEVNRPGVPVNDGSVEHPGEEGSH